MTQVKICDELGNGIIALIGNEYEKKCKKCKNFKFCFPREDITFDNMNIKNCNKASDFFRLYFKLKNDGKIVSRAPFIVTGEKYGS